MKTTTVETRINRKFIVSTFGKGSSVDLDVNDTAKCPDDGKRVYSLLMPEEATQLGLALVGENATVVTELPEVKKDVDGWVFAGSHGAWETSKPETVLKKAKELLAVHAFLVKQNEEQEAAKKAEAEAVKAKEAARAKRRDELTKELTDNDHTEYRFASELSQNAIDRIIDLEEAAKVS